MTDEVFWLIVGLTIVGPVVSFVALLLLERFEEWLEWRKFRD